MALTKADHKTTTYTYEELWNIDIVETTDSYAPLFEAWLYHRDYGIKAFMFGEPKTEVRTIEEFLEIVESNLMTGDYIDDYREDYID